MARDRLKGFLDLPLELDVILERGSISIRRLLELQPGALLCMAKSAGEEAELSVGDVPLARGDVTVAGNGLAVRITLFNLPWK